MELQKKRKIMVKRAITCFIIAGAAAGMAVFAGMDNRKPLPEESITKLAAGRPEGMEYIPYEEPEFVDDENRQNMAFNVKDFGEQGSNGWFYRYGNPKTPEKSRRMEEFDGERYNQTGITGLEMKKDFLHTGTGTAPILEWRATKKGKVNIKFTYVKDLNGDKNPSFPDGVYVNVYKGKKLLKQSTADIRQKRQTVVETEIKDVSVKELESIYFVIDPKQNNAYDGGTLYAVIEDSSLEGEKEPKGIKRTDNNASNLTDFGKQGANGWSYMYGKGAEAAELVSDYSGEDGYTNHTSPNLVQKKDFIHPAINDNAAGIK